jgi:cytoskeletal protein CcmA (bactofilin family)
VPKFGNVFSNEGKASDGKGSAHEGERRSGLTPDEIASRLYPKPADTLHKDEPVAAAVATAPKVVAEPEVVAAPEDKDGAASTDSEGNGQVAVAKQEEESQAIVAEPAPLTMISTPTAAEASPSSAVELAAPAERLVSVISRNSVFDGNYATDGDVRVEGEVRGDITCKGNVLICDGATVNAKISATSVAVAGRLSGEVTCTERFEAQPTARITSQISTPRLVIQEGAIVDGQVRMGVKE